MRPHLELRSNPLPPCAEMLQQAKLLNPHSGKESETSESRCPS